MSFSRKTRDASTSTGEMEFGFLLADFVVPQTSADQANQTSPLLLESSSGEMAQSEKVKNSSMKSLAKPRISMSARINQKKRHSLLGSQEDQSASFQEKEGSIVSSWSFLSNSNSSGSKEQSANPVDFKVKVKNYKTIIRVLIHDHGESTRALNS